MRRTKRALGVALTELMLAEEFDAITVQRVIDKAKVGRTTFYAHFRSTDDLLLSDAERFFGVMTEYFERPGVAAIESLAGGGAAAAHARRARVCSGRSIARAGATCSSISSRGISRS